MSASTTIQGNAAPSERQRSSSPLFLYAKSQQSHGIPSSSTQIQRNDLKPPSPPPQSPPAAPQTSPSASSITAAAASTSAAAQAQGLHPRPMLEVLLSTTGETLLTLRRSLVHQYEALTTQAERTNLLQQWRIAAGHLGFRCLPAISAMLDEMLQRHTAAYGGQQPHMREATSLQERQQEYLKLLDDQLATARRVHQEQEQELAKLQGEFSQSMPEEHQRQVSHKLAELQKQMSEVQVKRSTCRAQVAQMALQYQKAQQQYQQAAVEDVQLFQPPSSTSSVSRPGPIVIPPTGTAPPTNSPFQSASATNVSPGVSQFTPLVLQRPMSAGMPPPQTGQRSRTSSVNLPSHGAPPAAQRRPTPSAHSPRGLPTSPQQQRFAPLHSPSSSVHVQQQQQQQARAHAQQAQAHQQAELARETSKQADLKAHLVSEAVQAKQRHLTLVHIEANPRVDQAPLLQQLQQQRQSNSSSQPSPRLDQNAQIQQQQPRVRSATYQGSPTAATASSCSAPVAGSPSSASATKAAAAAAASEPGLFRLNERGPMFTAHDVATASHAWREKSKEHLVAQSSATELAPGDVRLKVAAGVGRLAGAMQALGKLDCTVLLQSKLSLCHTTELQRLAADIGNLHLSTSALAQSHAAHDGAIQKMAANMQYLAPVTNKVDELQVKLDSFETAVGLRLILGVQERRHLYVGFTQLQAEVQKLNRTYEEVTAAVTTASAAATASATSSAAAAQAAAQAAQVAAQPIASTSSLTAASNPVAPSTQEVTTKPLGSVITTVQVEALDRDAKAFAKRLALMEKRLTNQFACDLRDLLDRQSSESTLESQVKQVEETLTTLSASHSESSYRHGEEIKRHGEAIHALQQSWKSLEQSYATATAAIQTVTLRHNALEETLRRIEGKADKAVTKETQTDFEARMEERLNTFQKNSLRREEELNKRLDVLSLENKTLKDRLTTLERSVSNTQSNTTPAEPSSRSSRVPARAPSSRPVVPTLKVAESQPVSNRKTASTGSVTSCTNSTNGLLVAPRASSDSGVKRSKGRSGAADTPAASTDGEDEPVIGARRSAKRRRNNAAAVVPVMTPSSVVRQRKGLHLEDAIFKDNEEEEVDDLDEYESAASLRSLSRSSATTTTTTTTTGRKRIVSTPDSDDMPIVSILSQHRPISASTNGSRRK